MSITGSITPNRTALRSGEKLTLTVQMPEGRQFIHGIRIGIDLPLDHEGVPDFSSGYVSQLNTGEEVTNAGLGGTFSIDVDTLFYTPGMYTFYTFYGGGERVYCQVEIQAADPQVRQNIIGSFAAISERWHLFDAQGTPLTADPDRGVPVLSSESNYYLGLKLNGLSGLDKQVDVDFYSIDGQRLLYRNLLTIYTFPRISTTDDIALSPSCEGVDANRSPLDIPVHIIPFRTPDHLDYHEYDGQLRFSLEIKTGADCTPSTITLDAFLDDGPALPALPWFRDYVRQQYPRSQWKERWSLPFDTFSFRLVRIGNYLYTDPQTLKAESVKLYKAFAAATKGYFHIERQGVAHVNWENKVPFYQRVKAWYSDLPKLEGATHLDFTDSCQRHLIYLMFMADHSHQIDGILQQLYEPRSKGEDFTFYFVDGVTSSLGRAMGADGFWVRGTISFDLIFYTTDAEGNRVHRLDTSPYASQHELPLDFDTFFDRFLDGRFNHTYLNTAIHEMGHSLWMEKVGVSFGDGQTKYIPDSRQPAMLDDSIPYFTRNEYMSYGRDRSNLLGQTYGDDMLSRLLAAYQPPELTLRVTSHTPNAKGYYNVELGDSFTFEIEGIASSGISEFGYTLDHISGVTSPLPGALTETKEVISEGTVRKSSLTINLNFPEKGIYRYNAFVIDRLDPSPGYVHRDEKPLLVHVG